MLKTVSTANGLVSPTFSGNVTLSNGNLIIGTSGKGIDFSATPGTGTSELLNDYEEGIWTLAVSSGTGAITTVGAVVGRYTRIGRQVTVTGSATITTNGTGATYILVTGLPFAGNTAQNYSGCGVQSTTAKALSVSYTASNGNIFIRFADATYPGVDGTTLNFCITYNV